MLIAQNNYGYSSGVQHTDSYLEDLFIPYEVIESKVQDIIKRSFADIKARRERNLRHHDGGCSVGDGVTGICDYKLIDTIPYYYKNVEINLRENPLSYLGVPMFAMLSPVMVLGRNYFYEVHMDLSRSETYGYIYQLNCNVIADGYKTLNDWENSEYYVYDLSLDDCVLTGPKSLSENVGRIGRAHWRQESSYLQTDAQDSEFSQEEDRPGDQKFGNPDTIVNF